jgi:DNA-directed RNA polymerase subunit alpha
MATIDLRGLVRPQLVEATTRDDNPNIAEFRLQPLERGFGHTLGNAMRRMLLSSLRGAGVWGFRIDGVVHEHQTITGVVEDVHQIIGNLKNLVLTLDEDVEQVVLRTTVKAAGPFTAGMLSLPAGVKVVDANHHLFTVQDARELTVELYVNKGRGYVEADAHPVERGMPVDLVRIDAIYNPVRRANFTVAETRVGQRTDYDRLLLTVETDGTISPAEAVSYAAALAQSHFQFFASFGSHSAGGMGLSGDMDGEGFALSELALAIDDIGLGVRSINALKNSNVRTLGDLVRLSESQILQVKNFGKKSLEEVAELLERRGMNFGMRFEEVGDRARVLDWGTPPSKVAANAPDDPVEPTE